MNTQVFPRIAILDIPDKGKGVIALEPILKGTRIIAESPRIRVPHWQDHHQMLDLSSLSNEDHEFFMSFPPLEEGPTDPIGGRNRHLVPCVGSPDNAGALFETVCRLNHTCYSPEGRPNAVYTWVEEMNVEVVHAAADIAMNEEITVSYLQVPSVVDDPRAILRRSYGFECGCSGCQRPSTERSQSLARVQSYYSYFQASSLWPARLQASIEAPMATLANIEHNLLTICAEGYICELGNCAFDGLQLCGFYGDGPSASRWAAMYREYYRVMDGEDSLHYKRAVQLVKNPQSFMHWRALAPRKSQTLRGPSEEVLVCFKTAIMATQPRCAYSGCTGDATNGRTQKFLRCGACLEKLSLDIYYCSADCQGTDWRAGHKSICGKQVKV